ncbi:MAG: DUF3987 domain-containing protein [Pyrinomonadaceae bacterium]|jgi:hypothetical protein|nr:DUF3987 domain-containing protein [Pyrinomonadaceae bacterium]
MKIIDQQQNYKSIKMNTVTMFENFNKPVEDLTFENIIKDIKSEKHHDKVRFYRELLAQGQKNRADEAKKRLPAFTPSATFKDGRKQEFLQQYSGLIHLDFDKLTDQQLLYATAKIKKDAHTHGFFRSPSNNGIKVFIKTNATAESHEQIYNQIKSYYEELLTLKADEKCKDITRLCFTSYDPEAYFNKESAIFQSKVSEIPVKTTNQSTIESTSNKTQAPIKTDVDNEEAYQKFLSCIDFTNHKSNYADGNRNNYIYLLANNCNRQGLPLEMAHTFIQQHFDLESPEIKATVKSAYQHHNDQFAKFANFAKLQNSPNESTEDFLKQTPCISEDLFHNMPDLLKRAAEVFTEPRERDVFFTGALGILSGCLPNVSGIYAQENVYPNLFTFIIAPAASGKGALKFAKTLGDKYHTSLLDTSNLKNDEYKKEVEDYKNSLRTLKKGEKSSASEPTQPDFKVLYIPANSSYAKILSHIKQNGDQGIICETEADTMGNVMNKEWGGYSDLLRKAFHHEKISVSRKTNNEYTDIQEPRISIALAGTPGQVSKLISSAEDGLFSRFIFYAFKVEQTWKDVSPYAQPVNFSTFFKELSEEVYSLINFLELSQTTIHLSKTQWHIFNDTCDEWLQEVIVFSGENAGSVVKRLGLILYRICMIFTALRKFENGDTSSVYTCTDNDFEVAVKVTSIYLQHSLLMFHNLPKNEGNLIFKAGNLKEQFLKALPQSFQRKDAVEIAKTFNMSARSVDNFLSSNLEKYFRQINFGFYEKL